MTYGALIVVGFLIALALAWFVSWWFLLALPVLLLLKVPMLFRRARVLAVLASEYEYEFPPRAPQAYTLNQMERDTRNQKMTEHDLATLFMAVMCNSLMSQGFEVRAFCQKAYDNAARLRAARSISEDAFSQLDEVVRTKLGRSASA